MFDHSLKPVPYVQSPELTKLIEELKAKRGDAKSWLKLEIELMHFISDLDSSKRVLSRGEVRFEDRHYPAVLVYNPDGNSIEAWAQNSEDGSFNPNPPMFFHSKIPHVNHVRDALMHETVSTI